MKTAEKILGFASCALGLLPLIANPAKAQITAPVGCQGSATLNANFNGTTTLPVLLNPGTSNLVICGYSIVDLGPSTQNAFLVYGGGSACTSILGFSAQTQLSAKVFGPTAAGATSYLSRNGLAITLPSAASVCLVGNISTAEIELNYAIQ